jgi:hypothetical protein
MVSPAKKKKEKKNIPPYPPFSFYLFGSDWSAPIGSEYFFFYFYIFCSLLGTLMMTQGLGCSQSNAKSGASGFAWHFILPSRRRRRRLSLSIHLAVAGRRLLLLFVLSSTTPDISKN